MHVGCTRIATCYKEGTIALLIFGKVVALALTAYLMAKWARKLGTEGSVSYRAYRRLAQGSVSLRAWLQTRVMLVLKHT